MQSSYPVPGCYQRPSMNYFINFFKDPLNVDELLASVRPPPASSLAFKVAQLSMPTLNPNDRPGLSELEMGDDSTQEKAFLAALYLKDRLTREEMGQLDWHKGVLSKRLAHIVRGIQGVELRLWGFTTNTVLEHHQRVVQCYRNLEEGLQAGAYPDWKPTHFSNIARDLSILEEKNGLIQLRLESMEKKRLAGEKRKENRKEKQLKMLMEKMEQAQPRTKTRNGRPVSTATTSTKTRGDALSKAARRQRGHRGGSKPMEAVVNGVEEHITLQSDLESDWIPSPRPAPVLRQHPRIGYFVHLFKDPPNVDQLLKCVRPPPASIHAFKYAQLSRPKSNGHDQRNLSNLRTGDDTTRTAAFVAALYLKNRLSLEESELQTWCKGPLSHRMDEITREIQCTEPMLQEFSLTVLQEHHRYLINLYRDLEEGLEAGAYPEWKPTHFSNLVRELVILEDTHWLMRLSIGKKAYHRLSKEKKKAKALKKLTHRVEQLENPRPLDKARIDRVMVAIVSAMARNDHGVPVMVPTVNWDRGELFLTELEYQDEDQDEDEDGDDVLVNTQPVPAQNVPQALIKAKDSIWTDQPYYPASFNEPSQTPAPGMMTRSRPAPPVFNPPPMDSSYPFSDLYPGESLADIFKDPPNAEELLASIQPPPTSAQGLNKIRKSMSGEGDAINLLDLQIGITTTRESAFIAAMYLSNRLGLGEEELSIWCKNPLYNRVKGIAREIRIAEPKLGHLSVNGLVRYHESIITLYRTLEAGLKAGKYPDWKPTRFSNLVRELCIIEDNTGLVHFRLEREKLKECKKLERRERQMEQTLSRRPARVRVLPIPLVQ
ncbi:MAG: hypothetical protein J3Q66DRAFT_357814 [Benniella sp.]|nr:MAG: hypothetical protein J3Q66DRAFT_357814 [Benniella sp.]